ncbi:MAG TPA: flagellar hook-basal body complex protein [Candidatus Omnitrophota bacterium]|nr:flagellar hook-basal body complex protein [Candidatus Omnitrophota bacterium]
MLSETKAAPGGASGGLDIFTVRHTDRLHIQNQGAITATGLWSDLAISGRGFFMVAPPNGTGAPTVGSTDDPNAVLYTRAGGFVQKAGADARNYFVNDSGHYLLGWQADEYGNFDTGSLQPVYTEPQTVMAGRATTTAKIMASLPAHVPASGTYYEEAIDVVDNAGNPQQVNFNWVRTGDNAYTVTANVVNAAAGAVSTTAPSVNTWAVTTDAYGNVTTPTSFDFSIDWNLVAGGGSTAMTPAAGAVAPPRHVEKISLPVYDSALNAQTVTLAFERTGTNTWNMHVGGGSGTTVPITFNGDGKIVSPQSTNLAVTFTDAGPPPTTTTGMVDLDLQSLSQYDSPQIYLGGVEQNGYGNGMMRVARFNAAGELEGSFDNGETRILFKVPVGTFISENQLEAISGTMFRRTKDAGELTVTGVQEASGGSGYMSSSAVENSTVDIEDEFTRMIMTQKAYSTNATVFKTADEMTTVARDLK